MRPMAFLSYKIMALMMSVFALLGMAKIPADDDTLTRDEQTQLSFIAWGDTQISNYNFERENLFNAACADIANANGSFDGMIIAGDITENGLESEYMAVSDGINKISDKVGTIMLTPGNHDVRLKAYQLQLKRFTTFNNGIKNAVFLYGNKYYYSYEIKGYKFICLGTEKSTFEESYFSDTQFAWLEKEISSADSSKPVFVFCHQPLQNTHGLPSTWNAPEILKAGSVGSQSDRLKAVFNKHKNVVYITGHLHTGFGEYTVERIDNFYSVNLPAIGPDNADGSSAAGQGLIFNVYPDRIEIEARAFAEGKYLSIKTVLNDII